MEHISKNGGDTSLSLSVEEAFDSVEFVTQRLTQPIGGALITVTGLASGPQRHAFLRGVYEKVAMMPATAGHIEILHLSQCDDDSERSCEETFANLALVINRLSQGHFGARCLWLGILRQSKAAAYLANTMRLRWNFYKSRFLRPLFYQEERPWVRWLTEVLFAAVMAFPIVILENAIGTLPPSVGSLDWWQRLLTNWLIFIGFVLVLKTAINPSIQKRWIQLLTLLPHRMITRLRRFSGSPRLEIFGLKWNLARHLELSNLWRLELAAAEFLPSRRLVIILEGGLDHVPLNPSARRQSGLTTMQLGKSEIAKVKHLLTSKKIQEVCPWNGGTLIVGFPEEKSTSLSPQESQWEMPAPSQMQSAAPAEFILQLSHQARWLRSLPRPQDRHHQAAALLERALERIAADFASYWELPENQVALLTSSLNFCYLALALHAKSTQGLIRYYGPIFSQIQQRRIGSGDKRKAALWSQLISDFAYLHYATGSSEGANRAASLQEIAYTLSSYPRGYIADAEQVTEGLRWIRNLVLYQNEGGNFDHAYGNLMKVMGELQALLLSDLPSHARLRVWGEIHNALRGLVFVLMTQRWSVAHPIKSQSGEICSFTQALDLLEKACVVLAHGHSPPRRMHRFCYALPHLLRAWATPLGNKERESIFTKAVNATLEDVTYFNQWWMVMFFAPVLMQAASYGETNRSRVSHIFIEALTNLDEWTNYQCEGVIVDERSRAFVDALLRLLDCVQAGQPFVGKYPMKSWGYLFPLSFTHPLPKEWVESIRGAYSQLPFETAV